MNVTPPSLTEALFFLLCAGCATFCAGQGIINLPVTLVAPTAKVEPVKTGLAYCEGPTCDKDDNLYFSEMPSGQTMKIWKITPQGVATVIRTAAYFNGNECDPQGRLVSCQQDMVTRLNLSGSIDTLSRSGDNGFSLLYTNDVSIATTGEMFFTNHQSGKSVFYRSTTGALKRWTGFPTPNGVEWVEERHLLYLCLSDTNMVMTFSVATDGSISNEKKFAVLPVPDGITLDERYNVYVAGNQEGILYVYDSTGKALGTVTMQGSSTPVGNVSNCVFGGADNRTLYITGNGGIYKVQMLVAGRVKGDAVRVAAPYLPQAFKNGSPESDEFPAVKEEVLYDVTGRAIGRVTSAEFGQRVMKNKLSPASGIYLWKNENFNQVRVGATMSKK